MALEHLDGLELPAAADMHVHLRDGAMTELVTYILHSVPSDHSLITADQPFAKAE